MYEDTDLLLTLMEKEEHIEKYHACFTTKRGNSKRFDLNISFVIGSVVLISMNLGEISFISIEIVLFQKAMLLNWRQRFDIFSKKPYEAN